MKKLGFITILAVFGVSACDANPGAAPDNVMSSGANAGAFDPPPVAPQSGSRPASLSLRLSGSAPVNAINAVEEEAARQKMTQIRVDPTQSFAVIDGNQTVATLVTGEGSMPDAKRNGCFVAMKQGDETMLIPTLGYGEYEFETCGGPLAVGFVSTAVMPKLGIVFRSYSREAEETVPIIVEWDRSNNTLLIDDAASRRALDARATNIAQIRQALNGR